MVRDTHYDVLGVEHSADPNTLRRAYLAQARRYHPDFHVDDDDVTQLIAGERMRTINTAWHVLGDSTRRRRYDQELQVAGHPGTTQGHGSHGGRSFDEDSSISEHEATSGTAPPRWLTMAPALSLVLAVACFAVGFVTGLVGLLAAGLVLALVGAGLFLIVPLVALNRSKRG